MSISSQLSKMLGPLGAEVLEAVWRLGRPLTVREVLVEVNSRRREPLAYTTIMTVLARLTQREALARRRVGRAYVYEALVADVPELAVRTVIKDYGEEVVAHFMDRAVAEKGLRSRLVRLIGDDPPPADGEPAT